MRAGESFDDLDVENRRFLLDNEALRASLLLPGTLLLLLLLLELSLKLDNKFIEEDEADLTIRFEKMNFWANDLALLSLLFDEEVTIGICCCCCCWRDALVSFEVDKKLIDLSSNSLLKSVDASQWEWDLL